MTAPETPVTDVLVIGGSHAGLSAALTLYRSLHTTIVFDSGKPRSSYSTPIRHTATWEGQTPEEAKERSRKELLDAGFTTFVDAEVVKIEKTNDGLFKASDTTGRSWIGRKVLLATGAKDIFPDVPGYEDLYTIGIYPCMFQFGFEVRGSASAGVLAMGGLANPIPATMLAQDSNRYADSTTIYTNSNPTLASQLAASPFSINDNKIKRLRKAEDSNGGVVIEFEDGSKKTEAFIVHRPLTTIEHTLIDQLGVALSKMGYVEAPPPTCKTNIPGVYAAGDCASMMKIIPNALTMGSYAGCGLSRELPRVVTKAKS